MNKEIIKTSFIKSIPIMCSYFFVSLAYGIMMEENGFAWYYSLFTSLTVYTGAFQFVLITFLSSGASILTIALTAFLMNSRQMFYSLTFVEDFKNMGKKKLYMIHTMTDETYAVNCTLDDEKNRRDIMFFVALFSRCYWMAGAVAGGILGQLIPYKLEGIDFCMTALFVIILMEQLEKKENRIPAVIGSAVSVICLLVLGEKTFMPVSMIIISLILMGCSSKERNGENL